VERGPRRSRSPRHDRVTELAGDADDVRSRRDEDDNTPAAGRRSSEQKEAVARWRTRKAKVCGVIDPTLVNYGTVTRRCIAAHLGITASSHAHGDGEVADKVTRRRSRRLGDVEGADGDEYRRPVREGHRRSLSVGEIDRLRSESGRRQCGDKNHGDDGR